MRNRVILLAAVVASVAGCSQHGELPTRQSYIPPPAIASISILDQGGGLYDIDWDVADDSAVAYYRVYAFDIFGGPPEVVAEPTDTIVGVDIGVAIGGLQFGVAAVTVENVEGAMATVVTPSPSGPSP